ncbi:Subtilisin-like protease SBT3.8 [Glycine soja]
MKIYKAKQSSLKQWYQNTIQNLLSQNYHLNSGIFGFSFLVLRSPMALAWNLVITLILLVLQQSCFLVTFASSNVHIVYMGERMNQSEQQLVEDSHLDILSRILRSKGAARRSIQYSYKHGFSGFVAVLSQSHAKLIAGISQLCQYESQRNFCVCSGGNSSPYPQTVINTAPWLITVSARTIDREFPSRIIMGNNQTLQGQSLYTGKDLSKFYRIVFGEDIAASDADEKSARSCNSGSLNATLAKGKAILCFQSRSQRSATVAIRIRTVTEVGGAGLIFAQFPTKDVDTSWSKPCVQVDFITGTTILSYMEATRNPVIKFSKTKTVVGQQLSPEVAFFFSRGPSSLSPSVLKPDTAAPGVNILAAWSPASSARLVSDAANEDESDLHPLNFNIESGTSMACPHITGIVAFIKTIHPTWSPAALAFYFTKASLKNEYKQYIWAEGAPHKQADPFDYGGGHVDPNKVTDLGLVYDMKNSEYVRFLCSMGYNSTAISLLTGFPTKCQKSHKFLLNMNLPSIIIPELKQPLTISRTVTNVGPIKSIYTARVVAPIGISINVEPSTLTFSSKRKKIKINVTFSSKLRVQSRF